MLLGGNVEDEEKVDEEKEWTSIKVRKSTYRGLIRARAYLELVHGEKFSFDDTLQELFNLLGELSARELYKQAMENEGKIKGVEGDEEREQSAQGTQTVCSVEAEG